MLHVNYKLEDFIYYIFLKFYKHHYKKNCRIPPCSLVVVVYLLLLLLFLWNKFSKDVGLLFFFLVNGSYCFWNNVSICLKYNSSVMIYRQKCFSHFEKLWVNLFGCAKFRKEENYIFEFHPILAIFFPVVSSIFCIFVFSTST